MITRIIKAKRDVGMDMTEVGKAAAAVGEIVCPIHHEQAHLDTAVNNLWGVRGCCERLLDEVERRIGK